MFASRSSSLIFLACIATSAVQAEVVHERVGLCAMPGPTCFGSAITRIVKDDPIANLYASFKVTHYDDTSVTLRVDFTNNSDCKQALINGTFVIGVIGGKSKDDKPVAVIEWGNVDVPARGSVQGQRTVGGLENIGVGERLYADYIVSATDCE